MSTARRAPAAAKRRTSSRTRQPAAAIQEARNSAQTDAAAAPKKPARASEWTTEDDTVIMSMVGGEGPKWTVIAEAVIAKQKETGQLRTRTVTGKMCRERYQNCLDPALNHGPWTVEEQAVLLRAQREIGNQWAEIAKHLNGRSDNSVKNQWNSVTMRRYRNQMANVPSDQLVSAIAHDQGVCAAEPSPAFVLERPAPNLEPEAPVDMDLEQDGATVAQEQDEVAGGHEVVKGEMAEFCVDTLLQAAQVQAETRVEAAPADTPPQPADDSTVSAASVDVTGEAESAEEKEQPPTPEPEEAELEMLLQFARISDAPPPIRRPPCPSSSSPAEQPAEEPEPAQPKLVCVPETREASVAVTVAGEESDDEEMITPPPLPGSASNGPEGLLRQPPQPSEEDRSRPLRRMTRTPTHRAAAATPCATSAAATLPPETVQQHGAEPAGPPPPAETDADRGCSNTSPVVDLPTSPDSAAASASAKSPDDSEKENALLLSDEPSHPPPRHLPPVRSTRKKAATPEVRVAANSGRAKAAKTPKPKKSKRVRPKDAPRNEIKGAKRPWTDAEDALVVRLVEQHGAKNWSEIAVHVEGRVGKQCRERWQNHLDPSVSKAPWGPVEEGELMRLHSVIGNKWVEIATHMPGRTDSSCKNQFHKITYQRPSGTRKPSGGGGAAAKRGRGGKAGGGGGKRRKGETGRAVAAGKGGKGRAKAKAGAKGTGEVLEAAPGADLLLQFMGGLG